MSRDDWAETFKIPNTPAENSGAQGRVNAYALSDDFEDSSAIVPTSNAARNLGLAGAALLIVGTLVPIVSLPLVGTMTYFSNGQGDGVFVMGLGAVSIGLVLFRRFKWLWLTGLASLGLIGYALYNFIVGIRQMGESVAQDDAFGLGSLILNSVQLQWGWLVLIAGGVLTLLAARKG